MPWLIIIIGYLLGSIPSACIIGYILKGRDIRHMGDDNPGAANAYRELGPRAGILVFFIDAAKGALAILIAQSTNMSQTIILITGIAAIVGHNWPVFPGFRGGRGESTAIGVLTMLIPQPMLIMAAPTIFILLITKNVVIASAVLFVPLSLLS